MNAQQKAENFEFLCNEKENCNAEIVGKIDETTVSFDVYGSIPGSALRYAQNKGFIDQIFNKENKITIWVIFE